MQLWFPNWIIFIIFGEMLLPDVASVVERSFYRSSSYTHYGICGRLKLRKLGVTNSRECSISRGRCTDYPMIEENSLLAIESGIR